MKHLVKSFLSLALLSTMGMMNACVTGTCGTSSCCGTSCCSSCCCTPTTIYRPRSVGTATYREFLPYEDQYTCCFNGGVGVSLEYERTWDPCRIANCLFGSNVLNFVGSQVSGRTSSSGIVADYFGLSHMANGSITFCPRVQNFVADFNLYLGLDEWVEGMYLTAYAPLTWSKWKLQGDCCNNCCCSSSCCSSSCCCCALHGCSGASLTLDGDPHGTCGTGHSRMTAAS